MTKQLLHIGLGFMCLLFLGSCLGIENEVKDWWLRSDKDELYGKYHFLDEKGINLYLPEEFEKTTISDYQKVLDSLLDKESYEFEVNRINHLYDMDGGFHLFFDKYSNSTCTVNSMDFMPLSKSEAQYLLGMIRLSHERNFDHDEYSIEKLSAKYNGNPDRYTFKSIYMISNEKLDNEFYSMVYIITVKGKTVMIQITSPYKGNLDPYITKINL